MIYLFARVLTLDLDSYLLARGHPPTMGKKEQEKKAKRAAEGQSNVPPCKAAAPEPPCNAAARGRGHPGSWKRKPPIQRQLGGGGS